MLAKAIDMVVEAFAPRAAASRLAARAAISAYSGAYDGATAGRFRNNAAWAYSYPVDEDHALSSYDRTSLSLETANLRRNSGLVYGILDRVADLVVGSGITPSGMTTDEEWNDAAEESFGEWAKICDYRRRIQLWQLCRLAVKALFVDGEMFVLLLANGQVQPVEAARIATPDEFSSDPSVVQGIRLDDATRSIPVGYYICDRTAAGAVNRNSYAYVSASDVIHFCDPQRIDQLRGTPILASVINTLIDRKEYNAAMLLSAKLQSMRVFGVYSDKAVGPANMMARDANPGDDAATVMKRERHEAGATWYLSQGAKMESFDVKAPNSTYEPYQRVIAEEIACAVSIPYEVLMLKFVSSFSASRAALIMAARCVERLQMLVVTQIMQRLWNWQVARSMKRGLLTRAPLDGRGISQWYRVQWIYPRPDWIDPQAQVQADQLSYNMSTKSLQEIAQSRGRQWDDILDEKGVEIEMAISKAAALNERHGAGVTWRDLIASGIPGQTAAPTAAPTQPANQEDNQP